MKRDQRNCSYARGLTYELLVKRVYESLLAKKGIIVHHKKVYKGKSGQPYEIDLSFEAFLAGVSFLTLIECKNYNRAIECGDLLQFAAKIQDIRAHKGIMVTTRGFQKGAFRVALSNRIALVKVYRDGEVKPLISNRGPTVPELEHYFVDYAGYAAKGCQMPLLARLHPGSFDQEVFRLVDRVISNVKDIPSSNGVLPDSGGLPTPPAWWDWETIVTPHDRVNAFIRSAFLNSSETFRHAEQKGRQLIEDAIKCHEKGDDTSAIAIIEGFSEELKGLAVSCTEFDPPISIGDIPGALYWLGHFYASKGCADSITWWKEKGKFRQSADLVVAEDYYKEWEKELLLLGKWGQEEDMPAFTFLSDLGKVCFRLGKLTEAEKAFRRSLQAASNHAKGYVELGLFLMETGRYDEAIMALQESVSKKSDDMVLEMGEPEMPGLAFYNIACCYALLGQNDKALHFLSKVKQSGWIRIGKALFDPDLQGLQSIPEFRRIIAK